MKPLPAWLLVITLAGTLAGCALQPPAATPLPPPCHPPAPYWPVPGTARALT